MFHVFIIQYFIRHPTRNSSSPTFTRCIAHAHAGSPETGKLYVYIHLNPTPYIIHHTYNIQHTILLIHRFTCTRTCRARWVCRWGRRRE
ncbi:hypothetical protein EON63_10555 [archaeon]|nr:MAG: hypothetical protein EON63_10555 [archaeon]